MAQALAARLRDPTLTAQQKHRLTTTTMTQVAALMQDPDFEDLFREEFEDEAYQEIVA